MYNLKNTCISILNVPKLCHAGQVRCQSGLGLVGSGYFNYNIFNFQNCFFQLYVLRPLAMIVRRLTQSFSQYLLFSHYLGRGHSFLKLSADCTTGVKQHFFVTIAKEKLNLEQAKQEICWEGCLPMQRSTLSAICYKYSSYYLIFSFQCMKRAVMEQI